jgi:hypothetical protein
MKLVNKNTGKVLADNIISANNPLKRLKGLLGKKYLKNKQALHIIPCNSIHSCFMRFRFDAIFINKKNQIVYIIEKMPSWRISKICFSAYSVIEFPEGTVGETGTKIGDFVEFIQENF